MDIKYAIPSYNRVEVLKQNTLALLQRNSVKVSDIFVFVVPEEYLLYKTAFPEYQIVEGKVGLKNQRNYISEYFPLETFVLSVDDDIKDIIIKRDNQLLSVNNLQEVVVKGFNDCKIFGSKLFGFYPVVNKLWMTETVSKNFKFIIGSCFGYINSGIVRTITEKDDYEFSVLNYKNDAVVLRYNYISIKSNYYKTPGGLQSFTNRLEQQQEAVLHLLKEYPEFFALKKSHKTGFPELRVRKM